MKDVHAPFVDIDLLNNFSVNLVLYPVFSWDCIVGYFVGQWFKKISTTIKYLGKHLPSLTDRQF